MTDTSIRQHEIVSDGKTVWVNADNGECLGRFSKFGIDVHASILLHPESKTECLHCTHEKPDGKGWNVFQSEMLRHHGVDIGDEHKPRFI